MNILNYKIVLPKKQDNQSLAVVSWELTISVAWYICGSLKQELNKIAAPPTDVIVLLSINPLRS